MERALCRGFDGEAEEPRLLELLNPEKDCIEEFGDIGENCRGFSGPAE